MPKDNENVPLQDFELVESTEVQPFPADQMIRCETCLRANPPTRVSCLYCAAVLPVTEKTAGLQKPGLRRLESWEQGFNNILVRVTSDRLSSRDLEDAAGLLKLKPDDLERTISSNRSLPVARASSEDEAALIVRRLIDLNLQTVIIPDAKLRLDDGQMIRIRSASFDEDVFTGYQITGSEGTSVPWHEIILMVLGRLVVRRVEVKEHKSRRAEDDIVHASEFFADESVMEICAGPNSPILRIHARSFDFSVLGDRKGLVAGENLDRLVELIRARAPNVDVDRSYTSLRQTLEPVWRAEQRTEASGWHRERPGRYSTSGVTETSNEDQFTRYARLLYYLKVNPISES